MTVEAPYGDLAFPEPPEGRPYVVINMVATIDGKTVSATREQSVHDLGSEVDHAAMRQIHAAVDAVMIGAQTLRANPKAWYEPNLWRIVVTRSGSLDYTQRFFQDAPDKAIVACPIASPAAPPPPIRRMAHGNVVLDLVACLGKLRREIGIRHLLVEGGSELNGELLALDVVDELFLTLAPKVKLGRDTPTYAGGEPLERDRIQSYALLSVHRAGDELLLRYARRLGP